MDTFSTNAPAHLVDAAPSVAAALEVAASAPRSPQRSKKKRRSGDDTDLCMAARRSTKSGRGRHRATDAELRAIMERFPALGGAILGTETGLTTATIYLQARRIGVGRYPPRELTAAERQRLQDDSASSDAELALALRLPIEQVMQVRRPDDTRTYVWSPGEDARLREAVQEGWNDYQIADAIDVRRHHVRARRTALGPELRGRRYRVITLGLGGLATFSAPAKLSLNT